MRSIPLMALVAALLTSGAASGQMQTSSLPYPAGTVFFFVDKQVGNNANDGVTAPWRDLSFAYTQMQAEVANLGAPSGALIVAPGYYAPSNGELFPILMEPLHFIGGVNAHTTIVSLEGVAGPTSVFSFTGNGGAGRVFNRDEGPYLERLTIRNTGQEITPFPVDYNLLLGTQDAIRVQSPPADACNSAQPTLCQLIIYGFQFGVRVANGGPQLIDCTILGNQTGVSASPNIGPDPCCGDSVDVINSIVNGNTLDLANMSTPRVVFTNFTTATTSGCVTPGGVTVTVPVNGGGTTNPAVAPANIGFVNPTAAFQLVPGVIEDEFDFRLRATSPLRGIGQWTVSGAGNEPLWDGEGFINLRVELTATGPSDIGADQFNQFRLEPLTRSIVPGSPPTIAFVGLGFDALLAQNMVVTPPPPPFPATSVFAVPMFELSAPTFSPTPTFLTPPDVGLLAINPTLGTTQVLAVGVENTVPFVPALPSGTNVIMQYLIVDPISSSATRFQVTNGQQLTTL